MKKKFIIIVLVFLSIQNSQAQEMNTTSADLDLFLSSTLNVPITGNKLFDDALQKAFSKYWKVTPYKLLDAPAYSKLVKENEKQKKSAIPKNFLFQWGWTTLWINNICEANTLSHSTEHLLESHWLSDGTSEFIKTKTLDYVIYRLDYIVKGMNDIITYSRDNKLAGESRKKTSPIMNEKIAQYINNQSKSIKEKTLILNRDAHLGGKNLYNEKDFSKLYTYPHKFVSEQEFNEILIGEKKEYVCFLPLYTFVGGDSGQHVEAFEVVYEPSTKSTIYMWRNEKFPKRVKATDIEMLKKAIAK